MAKKSYNNEVAFRVGDIRAYRNAWRLIALLGKEHRGLSAAMAAVTIVLGLIPAAELAVTGLLVNRMARLLAGGSPLAPLYGWLLLLVGLAACRSWLTLLNDGLHDYLRDRVAGSLQRQIAEKAYGLELAFFENEDSYDLLQRANAGLGIRLVNLLMASSLLLQQAITVIGFTLALSSAHWALGLIVLTAAVPSLYVKIKTARQGYIHDYNTLTPTRRRLAYFDRILTDQAFAKEVRLFGLSGHLLGRWEFYQRLWMKESSAAVRREIKGSAVCDMVLNVVYAGAALFLAYQITEGVLSIGVYVMLLQAASRLQDQIEAIMKGLRGVYQDGLFAQNLFDFIDRPVNPVASGSESFPALLKQGISFEDVWFRYPGQNDWVLQGVTFHAKAGQTVSLVGRNGAGKTTLVKLLLGLHKPVRGCIRVDGVPLEQFREEELRSRMTAVFQDYCQFRLTLRESIGFGDVARIGDESRIREAAERSGASRIAERLEQGYEQLLSKSFGGCDLSGGQWQKVALARALMREAPVMVLDEPTAALDPRAEVAVFEQFRQLAAGRTTFLISHRIGTARLSDVILVLKDGRIMEQGSHDELVKTGGEYGELFNLQAQWYGYGEEKGGEPK